MPVGALNPEVWQYMPAVHSVKADRPVVLQNVPIGLSVKLTCTGAGQNAPCGQIVVFVLPIGQYVPLTHEYCVAKEEPGPQ